MTPTSAPRPSTGGRAKSSKPAKAGTSQAHGEDTRARIISAALETIRTEGIAGVSARSIARTGDFNQALIFYHFGSVDGLLITASASEADRRSALYADRLRDVTTLPELVQVARELHEEESRRGSVIVLTQMIAGTVSSSDLRDGLRRGFEPWMALVEDAVARVLAPTPLAGVVPVADLAFAVASMFLGAQLLVGLEPDDRREQELFASLDLVAGMVDLLLKGSRPPA